MKWVPWCIDGRRPTFPGPGSWTVNVLVDGEIGCDKNRCSAAQPCHEPLDIPIYYERGGDKDIAAPCNYLISLGFNDLFCYIGLFIGQN